MNASITFKAINISLFISFTRMCIHQHLISAVLDDQHNFLLIKYSNTLFGCFWTETKYTHYGNNLRIIITHGVRMNLCVNLTSPLHPDIWSNTTLDVSVKVFFRLNWHLNTWMLNKANYTPWHGWVSFHTVNGLTVKRQTSPRR